MSSTPDIQEQEVTHERLGALVREQREKQGISMDQLASRARVSRSSIHRLEHGHKFRPTPSKLARVLTVVGLDEEAVTAVLPDDEYRGEVLHALSRADQTLTEVLEEARPAGAPEPDLVAIHPDGAVARIQVTGDHTDELSVALRRAGWLVTRPD